MSSQFPCSVAAAMGSVARMRRMTADELRCRTLSRRFPSIEGTEPEAVLELFNRLGPIQSQVPRAPFLAAASRLPGVSYKTINGLFDEHRLLKTSNLRGTVHTSTRGISSARRRGQAQPSGPAAQLSETRPPRS